MNTLKINSRDFDFEAFLDTMVAFCESNFSTDCPDASETLRYFYSFDNELNNAAIDKNVDKWQLTDFKNAILQGGETIFLPFSSGPDMDGSVNLASDETVQLSEDDEVSLGLTDCFGVLVSVKKDSFRFNSAIAWGDMVSSIEQASHPKIDKAMKKFLNSFLRK